MTAITMNKVKAKRSVVKSAVLNPLSIMSITLLAITLAVSEIESPR